MSLFETIYRWRYGQDIEAIARELETLRRLPREEFLQWQEAKRWEIARYLYENNDFYRRHVGEKFPPRWEDLPIVEKRHLQGDFNELVSRPWRNGKIYTNNTSGSSGQPLKFTKDFYTQARVWAAKKLFFQMHGIDIESREARFYGIPKNWKSWQIQKLKDLILNRYRFIIFEMSDEIFNRWIERFKRDRFDYIYGYTSSIVLFCRHLIEQKIVLKDICPTLKVCIVTSEACTPEDKKVLEKATGIPVVKEYGTTDVGLIGYECAQGNMHISEDNVFVEVTEEGDLLITDLFNQSFPFIRYRVGDMGKIVNKDCPCGSSFGIIEKLLGRTNDVIRLPSGRFSPGFTFYYVSRALLESSGILKEFIIRQTALDTFEFDVVSDKPLGAKDIEELKKTAEEYLEPGLRIVVNQVDRIERPASGKIKHFYSELKDR